MPGSPKWSLFLRFPNRNPVYSSSLPLYALHAPPIKFYPESDLEKIRKMNKAGNFNNDYEISNVRCISHNRQASLCNPCCHGKATNVTYYESVLASCIFCTLYNIAICGLSGSIIFFHIISSRVRVFGKRVCFVLLYKFCLITLHSKKNPARYY
jgi:hypothetical protein